MLTASRKIKVKRFLSFSMYVFELSLSTFVAILMLLCVLWKYQPLPIERGRRP